MRRSEVKRVDPGLRLRRARSHHGVPGPFREPHPARPGARAQRVVQHHEPRHPFRRRRGEHRLPPAHARRRPADPGRGRLRLRSLCGVARPPRDPPRRNRRLRGRAHAAGLRHDRPRGLPDLGVLRGRDGARTRGARGEHRRTGGARDRLRERQARDARARGRAQAPRRADLHRPEPRAADPLRRRAAAADRRRRRLFRERLRVEADARADRGLRVGDRGALRERDHHLRRRGLRDPERARGGAHPAGEADAGRGSDRLR